MQNSESRLASLGIICCTNVVDGTNWRAPSPNLFTNIPLLWKFLEQIVEDWKREASPFQKKINRSPKGNESNFSHGFLDLQPRFFHCLFSHVMFFVALEGTYERFYQGLNDLNRKASLGIQHGKKPKQTAYVEKVRMIRDLSVVHMLDPKKKRRQIDAIAASIWQPLTINRLRDEPWDFDKITFGGLRLRQRDSKGVTTESADFEIGGIPELHSHCMKYIDEYDQVCADYLNGIMEKLPLTVGEIAYHRL